MIMLTPLAANIVILEGNFMLITFTLLKTYKTILKLNKAASKLSFEDMTKDTSTLDEDSCKIKNKHSQDKVQSNDDDDDDDDDDDEKSFVEVIILSLTILNFEFIYYRLMNISSYYRLLFSTKVLQY